MDWNPNNRAYTGGVGKPEKRRVNIGRLVPVRQVLTRYPVQVKGHRVEPIPEHKIKPVTRQRISYPICCVTPAEKAAYRRLKLLGVL